MARLAFYTCGMLREQAGDKQVEGFFELAPTAFETAAASSGFVAHTMDQIRGWPPAYQDWGAWGPYVAPPFYADVPDWRERLAATLSIWNDVSSVRSFAYVGPHAQALKNRANWFEQNDYPGYVMWWIGDQEVPTWREGADRLAQLHTSGSSPKCFTFSSVCPPPQAE
jgi:hypothetical protein